MDKADFYRNARDDLTGPLSGVTVIEATTTWAGPMAGCVLADFGARVIKVEHPDGEVARRLLPLVPGSRGNLSIANETVNRNKENVTLVLSKPEGREIFLKLAASADVVIENFRPGTLSEWGLGYEHVCAVKPDIVYVSISGYGQFGPLSDRVGYDPGAQHFGGFTSLNGEPGGKPVKAPTYLGDDLAGVHGALGALAALRHRDRTGEGQHIDVALLDSLLFQSNGKLSAGAMDVKLERYGNEFDLAAPVNAYECKDGYVFAGVLLDTHWKVLARVIGRPELGADSRYAKLFDRIGHRAEVDKLLADWCAARTTRQVEEQFAAEGLPACRVNTYAECAREPQVLERDMLQTVTLADGTAAPLTGPAVKFSRTPTKVRSAAEALGESTDAVLAQLGYDATAIDRLRAAKVI